MCEGSGGGGKRLRGDKDLDSHCFPKEILWGGASVFTLGENYSFNISYHFRQHKHSWKINSLRVEEEVFITEVNSF